MSIRGKPPFNRSSPAADDFLVGDGEMTRLIRAKNWSETPLGPIEHWPQSLRTTVSLCLASNFPMNIIWGSQHTQIYNEGYRVVCGEAHPTALGQNYRVTWASAWPAIGQPFERAMAGETGFLENQRMFLTRNGYLEETFFTFSLSPIRDEEGGIGGLFHPVTETTAIMLAERRTVALRDLTAILGRASTVAELIKLAIETLARSEYDLPFVLLYERDTDLNEYGLAGHHGIEPDRAATPARLADRQAPWPVERAVRSRSMVHVTGVDALLVGTRCGPYAEAPTEAFVLPISLPSVEEAPLILVVGVSPRIPLVDGYRGFYELIAATLSAALVTVRTRQDERRRAAALAEIDRAKTAFFSNVSHEFRTPLTLMLGPLEESLRQAEELPLEEVERIRLAYRNGRRLLKLVNTLLDFSRIEAGRLQAAYESTDLAALTAELASNFRSATDQAGLSLTIDAPTLSRPVYVDRDMWEKIILNLLSNAFKFTLDGGIAVHVADSPDGLGAQVTVRDTGVGVPAAELPRLFERFHRVEGSLGRSFEGSGIGLAMVQELVKLHFGEISVTSEPGRGTSFCISLPFGSGHLPAAGIIERTSRPESTRAHLFLDEALGWLGTGAAASTPVGESDRSAPHTIDGRIVLADDNADMRDYVQRLLQAERFEVITVENGELALQTARREAPDLILSDVMMPVLDGFGLLSQWRADPRLRDIPFLLLSARAGDEARVEGLLAGADDYLTKPFSSRELVARVRSNLTLARDRREAVLREQNAELERQVIERAQARGRIWQLSPELLGVLDVDGRIENCNPAWHGVLGWSEAEIAGTAFLDSLHPDDREPTSNALRAANAVFHVALRFESRHRSKQGDYRWLSWVAVPEEGKVYCSARDVTDDKIRSMELARAQESLRQSQKIEAIGRLTGGIAHDFNNLLMVITGGLDIVERQADPARRQRLLGGMRQAAQRGAALTRQLLAFSRRQALRPMTIDLAQQIDGMRELLDRSLSGNVHAHFSFASDLWPVEVDPGELELMILNLCVNARDAMPEGGTIEVGAANAPVDAQNPGEFIRLYVSDTGTGMAPDIIAHVFEPFFTTKDIGKGSGLGLAQVYGFVKQSGGAVHIDSTVGLGTTVSMLLPRAAAEAGLVERAEPSAIEPPKPANAFTGSVLLVEDDDEVAALMTEMLAEMGFAVTRAACAAAALGALANGRRIDLVLSDVMMPGGMDGLDLAHEIARRRPELPVLLTSGYAEAAQARAAAQGVRLLPKPFKMDTLADVMSDMLMTRAAGAG